MDMHAEQVVARVRLGAFVILATLNNEEMQHSGRRRVAGVYLGKAWRRE